MGRQLRIRQVRSGAGAPETQRRTLRSLGLQHHQDDVIQEDRPTIRGMIRKVSHLIEVEEVDANDG